MAKIEPIIISLTDIMDCKAGEIFNDVYSYIQEKYGRLSREDFEIIAINFKLLSDMYNVFNTEPENDNS